MSRLETILFIILAVIIIAYLAFVGFILYKIAYKSGIKSQNPAELNPNTQYPIPNTTSPYQTDFFNKSAIHAEKVLFGKHFIQEYGEPGYYGNKLLDVVNKLNAETKKSVIIAIKYMCIEPGACRQNERSFRTMAETEKVPLWFLILREAVKKVVPELTANEELRMQNSELNMTAENKIIPLYATG